MIFLLLACADGPKDTVDTAAETCDPPTLDLVQVLEDSELPGTAPQHSEGGVALGDLDGDGDLDAVIAWPGGSVGLRNSGGVLAVDPALSWDGGGWPGGTSVALADLDGDGDLDGYLGHWDATDWLFWNDGAGRFSGDALSGGEEGSAAWSGTFGDADGDGDLDLYISARVADIEPELVLAGEQIGHPNYLYVNEGGQFVRDDTRIPAEDTPGLTFHSVFVDVDGDGDLDLYEANDWGYYVTPNRLLTNDGAGRFSVDHTCSCEPAMYGMGVAVGDVQGDGWPDLYMTDIGSPDLLSALGDGTYVDASFALGAYVPPSDTNLTSWGTTFVDLDRNGCSDLVAIYGRLGRNMDDYFDEIVGVGDNPADPEYQTNVALLNDCSPHYSRATGLGFDDQPERDRAVAAGDLDGDGRADLVTVGKSSVRVWRAGGGCPEGLTVRLDAGGLNPAGIGSKVTVTANGRDQVMWMLPSTLHSASAAELVFGLGHAASAEVDVTWPDGHHTVLDGVASGAVTITP